MYIYSIRPTIVNSLLPVLVRQKIPCKRAAIIYYIVKIYYLISRILKGAHELQITFFSLEFRRTRFKVSCNLKDFTKFQTSRRLDLKRCSVSRKAFTYI